MPKGKGYSGPIYQGTTSGPKVSGGLKGSKGTKYAGVMKYGAKGRSSYGGSKKASMRGY